jgi:NADPH:quinone reductase-like Zn-dependent oxidoreductase
MGTTTVGPTGDEQVVSPPPEVMRAVVQDRYSDDPEGVLVVAEVPVPTPGTGEVLVEVRAAGVDRGVWHLMAGKPTMVRPAFGLRRPRNRIRGLDLAGTIVAVGPGVGGFAVGDEVFGIGRSAFAEYAVAPTKKLAPKPANLTFEQAASVPVSGLTAIQAVRDRAQVAPGQRVLVIGAAGGVGSFAVQIATASGAAVTAVCRGAKADFVRSLGATEIIDHESQAIDALGGGYDAVIDIAGNRTLRALRSVLAPQGRLVIVGGEGGGALVGGMDRQLRATLLSPFVSQKLGTFVSSENAADLLALRELIEAGSVTSAVDSVLPLADAAVAVRRMIDGDVRGKLVLVP